jgi:tetratricopeptide (TPR) repeat protein
MPSIEQIEKLLTAEPNDVFLNYSLAMEFAKLNRIDDSLAQFNRVLELDPAYCAAYYHQGKTYLEAGRHDHAKEVLQRGMAAARQAGDGHAEGEMQELLSGIP